MSLEDKVHLFNRDAFSLREEKVNKNSHEKNEARKEEEETELEMTEHGEEGLTNNEGENHVD